MSFSLSKLQIVVLLQKHQKVTAVAKELGIKQPTVSFHMKSLEKEYGVQLFQAKFGKVFLTEAGQALYHYAVKIHLLAEEARRTLEDFSKDKGWLYLGASQVPGFYLLPELLSRFSAAFPNIHTQLDVQTTPVVLELLNEQKIDMAVISSIERPNSDIISIPLMQDELTAILPYGHPLTQKDHVTIDDFSGEQFIFHQTCSSTRRIIEKWESENGIQLTGNVTFNSIEMIKKGVSNGLGISFISKLAIEKELEQKLVAAIPIPGLHSDRVIYCCYHQDRWLSPPLKLFLEEIRSFT